MSSAINRRSGASNLGKRLTQPAALPVKPCSSTSVCRASCITPCSSAPICMPLTSIHLLSTLRSMLGEQARLLKRPRYNLPELAMHPDVALPPGRHLDHAQTSRRQTRAHRVSEGCPVRNSCELPAVHLNHRAKVQAGRRTEKLLKMFGIRGLRQE